MNQHEMDAILTALLTDSPNEFINFIKSIADDYICPDCEERRV